MPTQQQSDRDDGEGDKKQIALGFAVAAEGAAQTVLNGEQLFPPRLRQHPTRCLQQRHTFRAEKIGGENHRQKKQHDIRHERDHISGKTEQPLRRRACQHASAGKETVDPFRCCRCDGLRQLGGKL